LLNLEAFSVFKICIQTKALANLHQPAKDRGKVVQYATVIKDSKRSDSASPSEAWRALWPTEYFRNVSERFSIDRRRLLKTSVAITAANFAPDAAPFEAALNRFGPIESDKGAAQTIPNVMEASKYISAALFIMEDVGALTNANVFSPPQIRYLQENAREKEKSELASSLKIFGTQGIGAVLPPTRGSTNH